MKTVEANAGLDKGLIILQFWYPPIPEDGVDRAVTDVPLINAGPITGFRVGRNRISTFLGCDGREIYVNEYKAANNVARKFAINMHGTHQYALKHTDIRAMDDFALGFSRE